LDEGSADFTPIDAMSPYLRNAILTSEDPSFYGHKGFVMESIRQSIAQNYVTKKFARGASTISMQLVKNIFLSRKKTLTRKFEEMMLVWMIENLHLTGKQRLFEVYLNIIEWGPGVYGAGEAARFYFKKPPAELTLSEAIFMASIIPRPKGFMWNFNDSSGVIKPHLEKYIRNISRLMAVRKLLSEEDTTMFNPSVKLTGRAAGMLRKNNLVPEDSLSNDIPESQEDWDRIFSDNPRLNY
jgi:membrane peptidoglycan carboxypeptidase